MATLGGTRSSGTASVAMAALDYLRHGGSLIMTCPCCKEVLNEDEILKLIDPKKIKSLAASSCAIESRG